MIYFFCVVIVCSGFMMLCALHDFHSATNKLNFRLRRGTPVLLRLKLGAPDMDVRVISDHGKIVDVEWKSSFKSTFFFKVDKLSLVPVKNTSYEIVRF